LDIAPSGGGNINTANSAYALYNNSDGFGNTAIGYRALFTGGNSGNTALGYHLFKNTGINSGGFSNTATGYQTLFSNAIGSLHRPR